MHIVKYDKTARAKKLIMTELNTITRTPYRMKAYQRKNCDQLMAKNPSQGLDKTQLLTWVSYRSSRSPMDGIYQERRNNRAHIVKHVEKGILPIY